MKKLKMCYEGVLIEVISLDIKFMKADTQEVCFPSKYSLPKAVSVNQGLGVIPLTEYKVYIKEIYYKDKKRKIALDKELVDMFVDLRVNELKDALDSIQSKTYGLKIELALLKRPWWVKLKNWLKD